MNMEFDHFRIRSWRPNDAEAIVRYANNYNIARHLRDRFPYPYTMKDARAFLTNVLREKPEANFAIEFDGEAVGAVGYMLGTDMDRVSAEIGYWLAEPLWGKGIMTAALRAATDYGFKAYDLTRIFATPRADNPASVRVLEKAGYTREALLRRAAIKEGKIIDLLLYSRIRGGEAEIRG
jgi:RimJ/RimL family protein N-acetyltransferase